MLRNILILTLSNVGNATEKDSLWGPVIPRKALGVPFAFDKYDSC